MADLQRVKAFLENHPHLELIKDNSNRDKVRCKLTNHELPCNVSAIESYTRGKKYQRLTKSSNEYEKYKEFLVPHEKKRNQLYCQLTKKSINNISHEIQQHVTGKRFCKALAQYKSSQTNKNEDEEDTGMWVPSDLESDSEFEEAEDGEASDIKESVKGENGTDFQEKLPSDECEELPSTEESFESAANKAHKRKNKQKQKRKAEGNSEDVTPSKKAKKGKGKKHSPKTPQKTFSKTKVKNVKVTQPKETRKQKAGKTRKQRGKR